MHRDATNNGHRGIHAELDTSAMRDAATGMGFSLQSSSGGSASAHRTHSGSRSASGPASCSCDGGQASWMAVTMIEDDDLMFGGKPLCTWYEEDRRCSMGEDSEVTPCSSTDGNDEEPHRGRQRDRLQDQRAGHMQQHHKKKHEKLQH